MLLTKVCSCMCSIKFRQKPCFDDDHLAKPNATYWFKWLIFSLNGLSPEFQGNWSLGVNDSWTFCCNWWLLKYKDCFTGAEHEREVVFSSVFPCLCDKWSFTGCENDRTAVLLASTCIHRSKIKRRNLSFAFSDGTLWYNSYVKWYSSIKTLEVFQVPLSSRGNLIRDIGLSLVTNSSSMESVPYTEEPIITGLMFYISSTVYCTSKVRICQYSTTWTLK